LSRRREKNNQRNIMIAAAAIIIIGAAGAYYYFNIYIPQYREQRTNLLTLFMGAYPVDLDPALAYETDSTRIIYNVFDRLVKYKPGTTEIEASLATSWTSPDPVTYVFTLREDVTFHDGTPFTADDVKTSLERVLQMEGPPSYILGIIAEIEVTGTYEVKMTLWQAFAPFLSVLANPAASIVSPTATEEYGEDFSKNPVGTGPFKFESWESDELVIVSNEDYFKGPPRLEKIVFKIIHEASARKEALEQGAVDVVMGGGILATDMPDIEDNPDITVHRGVSSTVEYLGFNTLNAPLNDTRVRQAIAHAIDYDALVDDALGGRANRIAGPIPPTIFGYKDMPLTERNLDTARELLEDAGYSDGFDISLTYNIGSLERRRMAEVIRDSLAEVDITVRIKGLDWDSAIDEYLSMGHEMMINGWIPDYFDPDSYVSPQFHTFSAAPYGANVFGLSDPEIDALIDEGMITSDSDRRLDIYHELQDRIVEEIPCVFLLVPSTYDCVRFNVENWVQSPSELFEAFDVYKE
jgi:peptide/nickel transport system substrate-binding protein